MVNIINEIIKFIKPVKKNDNVANFINSIVRDLSSIITSFENNKDFKSEILPLIIGFLNRYKHRNKKSIADLGSFEREKLLDAVFNELEVIKKNHISFNILNQKNENRSFFMSLKNSLNRIQKIRQKISNLEN